MKWTDIPLRPTPRMLRQFAGAWLVFFLALAAHQNWVRHHPRAALVLAGLGVVIGMAGLVRPGVVRWIYIAATVLAFPIGWVVSQVVLGAMFYVILTAVACWFRWRGRDLLKRRRPGAGVETFWEAKGPPAPPERYLREY
ncbi:MAG: hypothetical protein U1F98_03780 [Verrucomicrobiota bacterium]